MKARASERWVLVVAGHDPSGGAGVHADVGALEAAGVVGRAVVATTTEQDGRSVRSFAPRLLDAWRAEVAALLERHGEPAALKVGLIVDAGHVRALAELARELARRRAPTVVDPVLAASGGERFADRATVRALLEELVPVGVVLTPNVPEAAELAGLPGLGAPELAREVAAREAAARALLALGARAVVLKGGHGGEDPALDLVLEGAGPAVWCAHARVPGASLHGSGCRFASFVAGRLALGDPLAEAVRAAGAHLVALLAERAASAPIPGVRPDVRPGAAGLPRGA